MESLHINEINISPERQRQNFAPSALEDLATSIDQNGLIHPPAFRYNEAQSKFILVAGERRVRAMLSLIEMGKCIRCGDTPYAADHIPILNLGAISDRESFEAELAENVQRENLTWQERAKAEAKLHAFRSEQAASIGATQTLTDTATEVLQRSKPDAVAEGWALTDVSTRIRLAAHLDDPDVQAARTQKDAVKVIRQKQIAAENAVAAQAFDATASPHKLLEGDALALLPTIASESIDVLLTDPPYGIDAQAFGAQAGVAHNYQDSPEYFSELIQTLATESYRVCKSLAHAYVFCDPRRFGAIQFEFELAGWAVWPIPLIWAKGNGMLPRPEHAPRRTYECILFASKGDKLVKCVKPDVITVGAVRNLQHGAQKPIELYVDLLSRSANPGDVILDPFAGSGTIFPAANQCKLLAVAIELEPANLNICKLRMNESSGDEIPALL